VAGIMQSLLSVSLYVCVWGSGIRGLMRAMATLPKITRCY